MGISRDFALQMPGEQSGLHVNQPAHGNPIAEQRMRGFLFETALKRRNKRLAASGLECARRPIPHKIVQFDLAVIDDLNHARVVSLSSLT